MRIKELVTLLILTFSIALFVNPLLRTDALEEYAKATLYLSPETIVGPPPDIGEIFKLDVMVDDVTELRSWKVRLEWETEVLSCINAVEGSFLESGGATQWTSPKIDNVIGALRIGSSLLSEDSAIRKGVLATVTFRVVGYSSTPSPITFNQSGDETQLLSVNPTHREVSYSAKGATYLLDTPLIQQCGCTQIYLSPQEYKAMQLNEALVFSVMVEDVVDLKGFNIELIWDETKIEYVEHTSGATGLLSNGGGTVGPGIPEIQPGRALIRAAILPNFKPPPAYRYASGSGALFDITFKVIQATSGSEISLTETCLLDADNQIIEIIHVGNTTVQLFTDVPAAYTLTVNVKGSGSVTRDPDQATYPEDAEVSLTAVPESGWEFTEWSGDASGTTSTIMVNMDKNKEITAFFMEEDTDTVINPTASFTPEDGQQFFVGDVVILDASASTPGYDPLPSTKPSENPITSYSWQIDVGDDGSVDTTATGETAQYEPSIDGEVAINLTIMAPDVEASETHPDYVDTDAVTHVITVAPQLTGACIDIYTDCGGFGRDVSSDAYGPQEEVFLYAVVTYNGAPVVNKDVAFQALNPKNITIYCTTARSNGSGIAFASFRIPWPDKEAEDLFGTWHVWGTVDIAGNVVDDSVDFKFGYLIEILSVDAEDQVTRGSKIHVEITLQNIRTIPLTAYVVMSLVDEANVPINIEYIPVAVTEGSTTTVGLEIMIPNYAFIGTATANANVYDQLPIDRGVSYSPEATDTFTVTI